MPKPETVTTLVFAVFFLLAACVEQTVIQDKTLATSGFDSYENDCSKVGLTALPSPSTKDIRCQYDVQHPWRQP